ncbi:MAG: hypothetical protein JWR01_365 [Subtercola sp.]|jgi:hypothetical protein|nr:hypothetical protein [Subtercola sp.]
MLRNTVAVHGREFLLAQNTDVSALKAATAAVMASGGGFLDFVVVGNREVSVYLTPGIGVIFESHAVDYDLRDDGDLAAPFDE